MRKLIDRVTGVEIYVPDEKVEEYLAAGHKLPEEPKEKPKKKTAKKKG